MSEVETEDELLQKDRVQNIIPLVFKTALAAINGKVPKESFLPLAKID